MKKKIIWLLFSVSLIASDVVVDSETGLVWQDSSHIAAKSWSEAKSYCSYLSLVGYDDWRLPNIDELLSITDTTRSNPAIKSIFHHTKGSFYWSSSVYKGDSSRAWYVYFYYGYDFYGNKSSKYYVRCVRGRQ